jgi:hypothetical protein
MIDLPSHHNPLSVASQQSQKEKEDLPTQAFYTFLLSISPKKSSLPPLPVDVLRHILQYSVESYSRAMLRLWRRMRLQNTYGRILFCQKTDNWRLQIDFYTDGMSSRLVDIEIESDDGYFVFRYDSLYFQSRGYQDDGALANLFAILCEEIEARYGGDTDMFCIPMIASRQLYHQLFYEPFPPEEDPRKDLYSSIKNELWIKGILGILRSLKHSFKQNQN